MPTTASREGAIAHALSYIDDGAFETDLARRVAIRTESQKGQEAVAELKRYLDAEMIPALKDMGFDCKVFENPHADAGPILLATRIEDPALPTVLGYGHGDVIRGLEDMWTKGKGPWVTARDGDKLYGRGTADNKSQHTINMAALNAVLQTRGKLGFNAKVLLEMAEENGSKGLREIVDDNKDDFAADVFIGSDGPRASPDRPTITLGARGAENFDLVCQLREGGHHSGNWGGLIADPAIILTHAIASITNAKGEIQIKDWLPPPATPAVNEVMQGLEIEPGPGAPEIDPDWGQSGMTPAEKVYTWNSFAVLTMVAGTPERPVNAIAPFARAHCQLRYVAGTNVDDILPALRRHLDAHGFDKVEITRPDFRNFGGFIATRTEPDHPWATWVRGSFEHTSNVAPAVIPSMGGSICNDIFTDVLKLPAIWIPHSYAGCSQHAPDEHILMPLARSALRLMAGLYWDLGEPGTPARA